ncbi:MAG: CvpA family protein [Planctomycetes bacterium]|nr:CvpA family protein [Planctomycetota bacterium]
MAAENFPCNPLPCVMDNFPIQLYDVFLLALLVLTTVFGAYKGMAWQLASLGSLVVSYFVALNYSKPLAPHISAQEPWNRFLAMLILYIGSSLVIWLLFRFVGGLIERVRLREFDRQVGALFGLATGALLALLITFFAVTLSESARQAVLRSYSGQLIARVIREASPVIPKEVEEVVGPYLEQLDEKLNPDEEEAATGSLLPRQRWRLGQSG